MKDLEIQKIVNKDYFNRCRIGSNCVSQVRNQMGKGTFEKKKIKWPLRYPSITILVFKYFNSDNHHLHTKVDSII